MENAILCIGNIETDLLNSLKEISNGEYDFVKKSFYSKEDFKKCSLIVFFDNKNNIEELIKYQSEELFNKKPLLYIHMNKLEVNVGPFVIPGKQGCVFCMKEQENTNNYSQYTLDNSKNNTGNDLGSLNKFLANNISIGIKKEIDLWRNDKVPNTYSSVLSFSRKKMNISLYPFIPNPYCNHCSHLPEDNIEAANIVLQERIKNDNDEFRLENPKLELHKISQLLSNKKFGKIKAVDKFDGDIIPVVTSFAEDDVFIGRQNNFYQSELTSYLEALERSAGRIPSNRSTAIVNSYNNIKEDAIDPHLFGLSYNLGESRQYSEYNKIPWVWAYSFKQQKPMLVPEQIAFFANEKVSPHDKRFVMDSSNGCSLGHTIEESILHGLFEVIERDAFLLMWHGKRTVEAIDLNTVDNREFYYIKEKINGLGFDLFLFNTTTEFKIPSFAAIAVNRKDEAPKIFVSGGSHIIPEKAMLNCLLEASAHAQIARTIYENKKNRVEELYLNPHSIRSLEDHYLYYYHPGNFYKFDFLFNDIKFVNAKEAFKDTYKGSIDLTKDLKYIIGKVLNENYDILVVDQTPFYFNQFKLCASKVFIPGLLQLGVGIMGDRATHQERLKQKAISINKNIHPFP